MLNRSLRTGMAFFTAGIVAGSFSVAQAEQQWQPIELGTIFEDCKDPWISPPDGSSGALRQGWLNTFDGFFTKEWHLAYAWTKNAAGSSDAHVGIFRFQHPLTKRLWVGVEAPLIVNVGNENDFGDVTITLKKMLHETQDLSINTGMGIRLATGDPETGGDLWGFSPQLNVWSDLGGGWSLRGGILFNFTPEGNSPAPKSSFLGNVAIGHTLTEHDAAPLGDFTYYVAANIGVGLGGEDNDQSVVTITPGVRTHLGQATFFLAGVEIPVSNPNPFAQRVILQIVKGF